jgi:hypothetical protein
LGFNECRYKFDFPYIRNDIGGESGCSGESAFMIAHGCKHRGNIYEVFAAKNEKAVFPSLKISRIPIGYGIENFAGRGR